MNETKKLLIINACVNRTKSRTQRLGYALVERLMSDDNYETEEVVLEDLNLTPLNSETLNKRVDMLMQDSSTSPDHILARQLTNADLIVVLAPYWDLSYPAALKTYIEHISIVGTTFYYNEYGRPAGLCNAEKMYYVTTAGGFIPPRDLGFEYLKAYFEMIGVPQAMEISAQGLDVVSNDAQRIMKAEIEKLTYCQL